MQRSGIMRTSVQFVAAIALAFAPACGSGLGDVGPNGVGETPENPFPDDPFGDEGVCADLLVRTSGVIPTVSLLIDQSGSMTDNFGGQDRWSAVRQTLMAPGGVVQRLETSVRFGLDLYTSFDGGPTCPNLTSMAPSLNNYNAINAIFSPAAPEEDTPTGEAIDAVANALSNFEEQGPKIIVLGTDGEPDTCAEPDPQNGQALSVAAAERAFDRGIRTFVISVGDQVGAGHLQDMANAGVGLSPNAPEPAPYYIALNADELVRAFEEIIGGVTGCIFTLDGQVDISRAGDGMVALDNEFLEPGVEWRLVDGKTIELLGDACDTVQDGDPHDVAAVFPCGEIVVN